MEEGRIGDLYSNDGRVIQSFTVITMAAVSQVPEDDKAINSLCTFISKVRNT